MPDVDVAAGTDAMTGLNRLPLGAHRPTHTDGGGAGAGSGAAGLEPPQQLIPARSGLHTAWIVLRGSVRSGPAERMRQARSARPRGALHGGARGSA